MHRLVGQHARAAGGGAEEGGLAGVADAGSLNVGIEIGFQVSGVVRARRSCRQTRAAAIFLGGYSEGT
jgi:hypothetical protein